MNVMLNIREKTTSTSFLPQSARGYSQRHCLPGQHTLAGGRFEKCNLKLQGPLQRAAISPAPVHEVPPIVHEVLRSPGQQLDAATRVHGATIWR